MPLRLRKPRFQSHPLVCCQCLNQAVLRSFSSTSHQARNQRSHMFQWLNGPGSTFKHPIPGSTNYLNAYNKDGQLRRTGQSGLGDNEDPENDGEAEHEEGDAQIDEKQPKAPQAMPKEKPDDLIPFPMNKLFRSQEVLSEALKDEIWKRIMVEGQSVKVVSAALQVEMRRVGAVIRLKAVEKQWVEQGKRLATPYAKAVLNMLPQTPYTEGLPPVPHEHINELPVHRDTLHQIFHPVAESRRFTRVDASKVFSRNLLPADARIPHPELIEIERMRIAGVEPKERTERIRHMIAANEEAAEKRRQYQAAWEAKNTIRVVPHNGKGRTEFRFRKISVESVGKDGRSQFGVGARYGAPHEDRKRGAVKIPVRVE